MTFEPEIARRIGLLLALALAWGAPACYAPNPAEGLPCSPTGRCPDGQSCVAGVCRATGGEEVDAGPDANMSRPPIDPPVRVTDTPGRSATPSLVWTGEEYGIAWVETVSADQEIFFTRVNSAGQPLMSELRLTERPGQARAPSLVFTGSEYVVAWADDSAERFEIYLARLDGSGAPIGDPIRVTDHPQFAGNPSLVWTGSELALAWVDGRDTRFRIYFLRFTPDGVPVGADTGLTSSEVSSFSPSLVWTGDGFGLAWDSTVDSQTDVYFARLSGTGVKQGGDLQVTDHPAFQADASLTWNGTHFGVVWLDLRGTNREVYFNRLTATGVKAADDIRVSTEPGHAKFLAATVSEDGFGLVWTEDPEDSDDLFLIRLDADGGALAPAAIVAGGEHQSIQASVVSADGYYGVAWSDDRDGNFEIYLREL